MLGQRDVYNPPNISIIDGKIGLTNLDFIDESYCVITYTDDAGITREEKFFYVLIQNKHYFLSTETDKDFVFGSTFDIASYKFQIAFIEKINSIL